MIIKKNMSKSSLRVGDRFYIGTYMLDKFIGVDADVYAALSEYNLNIELDTLEGQYITGIYERVNKVLDGINAYTDYISQDSNNIFGDYGQDYYLGRDGVIVKSMSNYDNGYSGDNNDARYGG